MFNLNLFPFLGLPVKSLILLSSGDLDRPLPHKLGDYDSRPHLGVGLEISLAKGSSSQPT
jgi:hypothetical protein